MSVLAVPIVQVAGRPVVEAAAVPAMIACCVWVIAVLLLQSSKDASISVLTLTQDLIWPVVIWLLRHITTGILVSMSSRKTFYTKQRCDGCRTCNIANLPNCTPGTDEVSRPRVGSDPDADLEP